MEQNKVLEVHQNDKSQNRQHLYMSELELGPIHKFLSNNFIC